MEANSFQLRIGSYSWCVEFIDKDKEEIKGCDGRTLYNEFKIIIRNDLNYLATQLVLRHEVVHALLSTQGRVFQKKYDVEEMCELVAYRLSELEEIDKLIEYNLSRNNNVNMSIKESLENDKKD